MFEDLEDDEFLDDEFLDDENPPEESNNRNFLIIAGVLGGITLIAILCLGGLLYFRSQQDSRAVQQQTQAAVIAMQTQEQESIQQTVIAESWTDTPTAAPSPTNTQEPTAVVVLPSATPQEEPTENPATATISALLTAAAGQATTEPGVTITAFATATGLPDTGLFDDLGVTGLILLAFFAIVVIFLARRLRAANG
jgi:hypothetical protein